MDKKKITIFVFAGVFFILILLLIINSASLPSENSFEEDSTSYRVSNESTFPNSIDNDNQEEKQVDNSITIYEPAPISDNSEIVIRKSAFVVSYNPETKCPNWVAWHLTASHTDGPFPRLNNFFEENVSFPHATLEDYRGSGWSRGHMCPAGDNKWSEQAMRESFSLLNICPQNASLNSGLWNSIEIDCRNWANKFGDIYIVCGPIYLNKEHTVIGENKVLVPEAFFKVVLCLNETPKAFGFIVRNTEGNSKRDLYYNSIDQVERITGYDFFYELPDDVEDNVESTASIDDWK